MCCSLPLKPYRIWVFERSSYAALFYTTRSFREDLLCVPVSTEVRLMVTSKKACDWSQPLGILSLWEWMSPLLLVFRLQVKTVLLSRNLKVDFTSLKAWRFVFIVLICFDICFSLVVFCIYCCELP